MSRLDINRRARPVIPMPSNVVKNVPGSGALAAMTAEAFPKTKVSTVYGHPPFVEHKPFPVPGSIKLLMTILENGELSVKPKNWPVS